LTAVFLQPDLQLPWSSAQTEDTQFKKILRNLAVVFCVCAVAIPFLPTKQVTREQREVLPPQLARVILEKQAIPKIETPKPKSIEKPKEKEKPKPKEKKKEVPKEKPKPVDKVKKAKQQARAAMMQFQDDLADMRDTLDVKSLESSALTKGATSAAKVERSLITSKSKTGSGGINTAALSRDTGGVALSGKEDVKVDSPIALGAGEQGNAASVKAGGRSDESVRRMMDKNKGAIFAIYNRALRKDPTLEGKFVFEMVIEPSGQVSEVSLISSQLEDDTLVQKILSRIRLIRFPAGNVISTRVNYSFDFLPY